MQLKTKTQAWFTLGFLALATMIPAFLLPSAAQSEGVYESHGSINITHNNDFRLPTAGVRSGHGTSSDPYIIEGWEFTGDASILITGTNAFFVIRNCRFDGVSADAAVLLTDLSNAVITGNVFTNNQNGLQVERASRIDVFKNEVRDNQGGGIVFLQTGDIKIHDNKLGGNGQVDLSLNTTRLGRVETNEFRPSATGLRFSEGAGFKLANNQFTSADGEIGASLAGMDGGEIMDNKFAGFHEYGLQVQRSKGVTIQNNEMRENGGNGTGAGVSVESSSSLKLVGNLANANRGRGVYLLETSESWVQDGEANGNGNDGIELFRSSYDGIRNMQTKDNGRAGINLNESSNNLVEANTVTGNKVARNGSLIVGGNTNKVVRNEVAHNAGHGILIAQWMSDNRIMANNAHDNKMEDIYSDADPNANIISSEELPDEKPAEGPDGSGKGPLPVPGPQVALLALAVLAGLFVRRRRA